MWFGIHCRYVARKGSGIPGYLFRILKSREPSFHCKLFSPYVLPVTDYASVVYHSHSVKNSELIESMRTHFNRSFPMFFSFQLSYPVRIRVLGLDSPEVRMLKGAALCFTCKLIYRYADLGVNSFFSFSRKLHDTRKGFNCL